MKQSVIVFDFKGRRIGTYPTILACSLAIGIDCTTVSRLLRTGKALKRNGMTFDVEDREDDWD